MGLLTFEMKIFLFFNIKDFIFYKYIYIIIINTSYDMLDFKSYTKSLTLKYLVIERHMLQIQGYLHGFFRIF